MTSSFADLLAELEAREHELEPTVRELVLGLRTAFDSYEERRFGGPVRTLAPSFDALRKRAARARARGENDHPDVLIFETQREQLSQERIAGLRPCGTAAAYSRGCRCPECKRANAERHRISSLKNGRTSRQYAVPYRPATTWEAGAGGKGARLAGDGSVPNLSSGPAGERANPHG